MTHSQALHEVRCLLMAVEPLLQQIVGDYPEFETARERARLAEIATLLKDTESLKLSPVELRAWEKIKRDKVWDERPDVGS